MEKLKSKNIYILIAMASISFIAYFLRKKILSLLTSEEKKARMIQQAIDEVRREQAADLIKSEREKQASQIMAFSKYGHQHK